MVRIDYCASFLGYSVSLNGTLNKTDVFKCLEKSLEESLSAKLLVDLSDLKLLIKQNEIQQVIDDVLKMLLVYADKQIALVSCGSFETAVSMIMSRRLNERGLLSKVFYERENAAGWLTGYLR